MFDPIALAASFASYVRQFDDGLREALVAGVAFAALKDIPEELQVVFLEYLAEKFNLGFYRIERPNKEADTGATTEPGPETERVAGIYLGRILPAGNA